MKDIGIVGMAVMGKNLAINFAKKGYSISIFNRSRDKIDNISINYPNYKLFPFYSIKEFIFSLKKPRCILLMIKTGSAIDDMINSFSPFLETGDILIDGGNSFYKDTIRRHHNLLKIGIHFIDLGISGGEYGALHGPSIIAGGNKVIYNLIEPIFRKIVAKFNKKSCIMYSGKEGSGHYVKMVHNGIEYGNMQLISEAYFLLKKILKLNNLQLSEIFDQWNHGELNSYLIDITKDILKKEDKDKKFIIDYILDIAHDKGTGVWASKNAIELCCPCNILISSVIFRHFSSLKKERMIASNMLNKFSYKNKFLLKEEEFIEKVRRSLFFGKVISYAQGFDQLKFASIKYNWKLNYKNIAAVFRSGCIIRSKIVENIVNVYETENEVLNLVLSDFFINKLINYQKDIRTILSYSIQIGIPVPALLSAITYYDILRSKNLSTNLIQAQRDYFGSHFYERVDQHGMFHTEWIE